MYIKRLPAQLNNDGKYINKLKITFSNSDEYSYIMNKLSAISSNRDDSKIEKIKINLVEKTQAILTNTYVQQDKTENNHPSCVIEDWAIETILPLLFLTIRESGTGYSEEEFEKQKQEFLDLQSKCNSFKEINTSLTNQIKENNQKIEENQNQIEQLLREKAEFQDEKEKYESSNIDGLKVKLLSVSKEKDQLQSDYQEAIGQLKTEKFNSAAKDNEIKNLNTEIERLKKEINSIFTEKNASESDKDNYTELQKKFEFQITDLKKSLDNSKKLLEKERINNDELSKKIKELSAAKNSEPINANLYSDANEWHEKYNEIKDKYDKIAIDYSEAISKTDNLKKEISNFENQISNINKPKESSQDNISKTKELENTIEALNQQAEVLKLTVAKLKQESENRKKHLFRKKE